MENYDEPDASPSPQPNTLTKWTRKIRDIIVSPQFLLLLGVIGSAAFIFEGILCYVLCQSNVRSYILSTYYIIFGFITIGAEIKLNIVTRWFRIIATYTGRGFWYVFLGSLAIGSEWWALLIAFFIFAVAAFNLCAGCGDEPNTADIYDQQQKIKKQEQPNGDNNDSNNNNNNGVQLGKDDKSDKKNAKDKKNNKNKKNKSKNNSEESDEVELRFNENNMQNNIVADGNPWEENNNENNNGFNNFGDTNPFQEDAVIEADNGMVQFEGEGNQEGNNNANNNAFELAQQQVQQNASKPTSFGAYDEY